MLLQRIARTNPCQKAQQRHEPRIQDIHHHVLILRHVRVSAKTTDSPENALIVVEIDYMIQQNQEDRHPAQIVYPMLSHFVMSPIT